MAAAKPGIVSPYVLPLFVSAVFLGFLSLPSAADSVLYSGRALLTGQSLVQGNYTFVMQEDCNLVLYYGRSPLWASLTYHMGFKCVALLQGDGDLVIFSETNRPLWSTGTGRVSQPGRYRPGRYVLVLQPNGNVVIYGSYMWATGISAGYGGADKVVYGTSAKKTAVPFTPGMTVVSSQKGRQAAAGSHDEAAGTGNNNRA